MGRNLALNLSRRGYKVVVYNRTKEVTDRFISGYGGSGLTPAYSPDEVARKLDAPRIILLMVTAGKAVDDVIRSISPYLSSVMFFPTLVIHTLGTPKEENSHWIRPAFITVAWESLVEKKGHCEVPV